MTESNRTNKLSQSEELPAHQRISAVIVIDDPYQETTEEQRQKVISWYQSLYPWMLQCANCGARLARWGWYEAPNEPIRYYYCLDCDLAGREPCIQVRLINELTKSKEE